MKVLTVGGGSGGHVTPVLAVINELKKAQDPLEVRFWSDRRFAQQAKQIIQHDDKAIKVRTIFSGKFRRYHNSAWWKQLLDLPTTLKNVGDAILLAVGSIQSIALLVAWRPDVIFTKGGFVCLPVGLAAKVLRIPLVIHDSDAHPGLTNRILAPWARVIATGASLSHYNYPKDKAHYVGIPISDEFKEFSSQEQVKAKQQFGVAKDAPLIVVTGGGLGAQRINMAMAAIAKDIINVASVIHITGAKQFDAVKEDVSKSERYILFPFVTNNMAQLLGAADVVVTRAGATTLLELAGLKKAVIVIPNAMLTGGHQLKNAKVYEKEKAVIVVDEMSCQAQPSLLRDAIVQLLNDTSLRHKLEKRLGNFAKPRAALDTAQLIIKAAKREV